MAATFVYGVQTAALRQTLCLSRVALGGHKCADVDPGVTIRPAEWFSFGALEASTVISSRAGIQDGHPWASIRVAF